MTIACLLACSGCADRRESPTSPQPAKEAAAQLAQTAPAKERAMKFELASNAFKPGSPIPTKFSGEGADVSPPLEWSGAPTGTKEFAIVCDDPDAPTPEPWVHWVIYGIGPDIHSLPEGIKSNMPQLNAPVTARQGKNSWPSGVTTGYRGPLPPPGHGMHHYHFQLYALDKPIGLPAEATKQQVLDAMKGHVLAETELVGTYERKR